MRVTGIETTKKGRYALMVDGEFAFSLHRDTFLLCPWLQKGAEVSPERLRREVDALMDDPARLERMAAASRGLARPDAAADIAREVLAAARGSAA